HEEALAGEGRPLPRDDRVERALRGGEAARREVALPERREHRGIAREPRRAALELRDRLVAAGERVERAGREGPAGAERRRARLQRPREPERLLRSAEREPGLGELRERARVAEGLPRPPP